MLSTSSGGFRGDRVLLKDKVAIVTGAARGIGLSCARLLADAGAAVALCDIDDRAGNAQAEEIRRAGQRCEYFHMDVTDWDSVQAQTEAVAGRFGRIDVLVNNAGYHNGKGLVSITVEEWDRLLALNLRSVFLCCKAAVPHLREAGGVIVNMASCAGLVGQPQAIAYSASKAGIIGFTKSLALELAAEGIRVNCVCPSNVDTPLMTAWIDSQPDPAAARKFMEGAQPIGRMASSDEIAKTVVFLASSWSSFMTGEAMVVDGGATLGY
jgi:NAD(P)-dependent dehydrogenase (short-subunit alcohol dehydrogenase family)